MIVPAFLMNDQPRSHIERSTLPSVGRWYAGSSITNGAGSPANRLGLLEDDAGHDDGSHTYEVSGSGDPRRTAEDCACYHSNERNLSAAGDERCRHDCHTAVTFVFNSTGCHDTGDTAACTDKHRNEGFTGETELTEDTVEDECDTSHVAARFKECKEEEEDEHLRNKSENCADAGYDTVKDKSAEPICCACRFKTASDECGNTGNPYAEVSRIGSSEFFRGMLCEVVDSFEVCNADRCFFVSTVGNGGVVNCHVCLSESFLILDCYNACSIFCFGNIVLDFIKSSGWRQSLQLRDRRQRMP